MVLAVPPELVDAAQKAVNAQLRFGEDRLKEAGQDPSVTALFRDTAVRGVVEQLLGAHRVPNWAGNSAQIALLFPASPTDRPPQVYSLSSIFFFLLLSVFRVSHRRHSHVGQRARHEQGEARCSLSVSLTSYSSTPSLSSWGSI